MQGRAACHFFFPLPAGQCLITSSTNDVRLNCEPVGLWCCKRQVCVVTLVWGQKMAMVSRCLIQRPYITHFLSSPLLLYNLFSCLFTFFYPFLSFTSFSLCKSTPTMDTATTDSSKAPSMDRIVAEHNHQRAMSTIFLNEKHMKGPPRFRKADLKLPRLRHCAFDPETVVFESRIGGGKDGYVWRVNFNGEGPFVLKVVSNDSV